MAITIGGSAQGTANNSTTCATAAFGTQPTAGSTIVVCVGFQRDASETLDSVADNASGNTYTRVAADIVETSTQYRVAMFYAKNVNTTASFTVTATWSAASFEQWIVAVELKGADTTAPLDGSVYGGQMQTDPGTGTDAVSTGTLASASVDGCCVVACTYTSAGSSITAGTNYTELYEPVSAGFSHGQVEYRIQTTAAAATATWTQDDATADFASFAASFKPTGGGGGGSIGFDDADGPTFFVRLRPATTVRLV